VRRPRKKHCQTLLQGRPHQATLDPLAARRPRWRPVYVERATEGSSQVVSGNANYNNSSAAALLSYDVAHAIPWDWKVSLNTWTKGIASGVYLVAALMVLLGFLSANSPLWLWLAPAVSGSFSPLLAVS